MNEHKFDSAMKALEYAVEHSVSTPFYCRVKNSDGKWFDAEITTVDRGYCCSAKI